MNETTKEHLQPQDKICFINNAGKPIEGKFIGLSHINNDVLIIKLKNKTAEPFHIDEIIRYSCLVWQHQGYLLRLIK